MKTFSEAIDAVIELAPNPHTHTTKFFEYMETVLAVVCQVYEVDYDSATEIVQTRMGLLDEE